MMTADRPKMTPSQAAWIARAERQGYTILGRSILADGRVSVAWRGLDGKRNVTVLERDPS